MVERMMKMGRKLFIGTFITACIVGVLYVKFVAPSEASADLKAQVIVEDITNTLKPPSIIDIPDEENIPISNVKPIHEPIIIEPDSLHE